MVTPPSWRLAIITAFVSTGMLIAATTLAQVPDRVQTVGTLLPTDGLFKIRAPRAGEVEALLVRNGEHVKAGRPILRISGAQSAPGEKPEVESRIVSLERERQAQSEAVASEMHAVRTRIQHNRDRRSIIGRQIVAVAEELKARESQLAVYEERVEQLAKLAESDAIAVQFVNDARLSALQASATIQEARQRLLELEEKRLLVELQLEDDRLQIATLRERAAAMAEILLRQIETARLQSSMELLAARDGIVSGLTVSRGQLVQVGDVIATQHDPNSPLEARLYLPPGSAGRIVVGQQVELALHAYPREIYGTLTAVIGSVSPAAIPAREFAAGVAFDGPVFELRATLLDSAIHARGSTWSLPAGTAVSADIIRERWPLYRWLWKTVAGGDARS